MLRPRFYTQQPLATGATVTLEKEPSRHVAKALRMGVGDPLCLFDGSGREAHGTVSAIERSLVQVSISEVATVDRESPLEVILAISLSRGDRVDTIVQKATELGVAEIWPLVSERTEVRLDGTRLTKKRDHWERVAISACEQCGRNRVPLITATKPFRELLTQARDLDALRLILHPGDESQPLPPQCGSLLLMVGPEGGFSDGEIAAARECGFSTALLGPRVLRTETAPLAALAVAQARWGDLLG